MYYFLIIYVHHQVKIYGRYCTSAAYVRLNNIVLQARSLIFDMNVYLA